ncbi:MAG TPA: GNAT family N-acetyltransferase [Methylomirabilota bacterium]|nr:GNAT family N-acetyltransferase [Methylomirabilota bacterium]
MHIRLANDTDYEAVMNLYNDFVGNDRYSTHDHDSFKKVINNSQNFVFVAEDKGKLVGFATFSIRDVIRYPRPIAELDELFVSSEYRQKGLGKKLMQYVEEKARDLGCYRMFIESHYDHKAAHAFYEGLGYTNYGYHFIKNL